MNVIVEKLFTRRVGRRAIGQRTEAARNKLADIRKKNLMTKN